jgi:hypothetical protein
LKPSLRVFERFPAAMSSEQSSVPRKALQEASVAVYRPPSSEAGPSSSTNPEHHDDDRPNTPPPYSGPTTSIMVPRPAPQPQPTYPGLPHLDYRLYSPPSFTLSSDRTTITSYEPRYSIYPAALVSLIQALATVPPKPEVRIVGTNGSNNQPDFDIKLNIMNLIVPDREKSGRMNYVKIIGPGEVGLRGDVKETVKPDASGLENWARLYCEDQSSIKQ